MDVLLPSLLLVDRLSREEQHFKRLGLHAHAEGIRAAIDIVIREVAARQGQQQATFHQEPQRI